MTDHHPMRFVSVTTEKGNAVNLLRCLSPNTMRRNKDCVTLWAVQNKEQLYYEYEIKRTRHREIERERQRQKQMQSQRQR